MRRRDLLRAAAVGPLCAAARVEAQEKPRWPGEEKLDRSKREIVEAMAKVRLANADAPDLLPRPRRRR